MSARSGRRKVELSTSVKRIDETDKQRQALELRKAGVGFDEIAQRLGYRGASGAYYAVKTALQKTIQQPANELREIEVARLDALLLGLWPEARKGNVAKIDRVLRIMQRRADLLGLDAPKRINATLDIRDEADRLARENGLPVDAVLAEAERIVRGRA